MFKKLLFVSLVVFGMVFASTASAEFTAMYDKGPDCFMSLDYTLHQGPAPDVWVIKSNKPLFERKYLRSDADLWRNASASEDEVLPCRTGSTVAPAWFCPEVLAEPVLAVVPPPLEPKTFIVYFDFDKDTITEESKDTLVDALTYAQELGYAMIKLESSCDFRGTDEYNMDLGMRRAAAVQHWLIEYGINPAAFAVDNKGEAPEREREGRYCAECWSDRYVKIDIE